MEISGNLPITNIVAPYAKAETASDTNTTEANTASTIENESSISDDTAEIETTADSSEKAAGVIRKLQAGHFKGVADVRLRINFNDQLQALQAEKTSQVIESAVPSIIDSQASEVSEFLAVNNADSDIANQITTASQAFSENIEQIAAGFQAQETKQTDDLVGQLQASFDKYISELGEIGASQAEPEAVVSDEAEISPTDLKVDNIPNMAALATTETALEETVIETERELLDFSQLIANLTESFNDELDSLVSELANSSVLPEISAPSGNGRAFDKFMKIYNNLNSLASQEKPPETTVDPEIILDSGGIAGTDAISGVEQISILAR